MMKKLLSLLIPIFALVTISLGTVSAATNPFGAVCNDPNNTSANDSTVCATKNDNPIYGPTGIIVKVTKIIAIIAGIASVIIIMVGGLMYITSAGDSGRASSARSTVLYALVGLIIIIAAQTIIVFVIDRIN